MPLHGNKAADLLFISSFSEQSPPPSHPLVMSTMIQHCSVSNRGWRHSTRVTPRVIIPSVLYSAQFADGPLRLLPELSQSGSFRLASASPSLHHLRAARGLLECPISFHIQFFVRSHFRFPFTHRLAVVRPRRHVRRGTSGGN